MSMPIRIRRQAPHASPHPRRRAMPWLAMAALVVAGWLAPALEHAAWAQTITVCNPAATKGTDGPVDFGAYCWIDFTSLNLATAKAGAGQAFQVNLRGGAYLTFNLKITPGNTAGNNMYSVAVPSWSGAAFGNSAFNSIPGRPILYQDTNNQNAPQDTVTLSSLTLHANGSTELPFVFVAADGESSNAGETLSFTTTGAAWSLVAAPGASNPARNMPTLSPPTAVGSSTGVQTVNIAGTDGGTDGEGSYVFTTDNSPGTVTTTMQGNGLQGVLFGVKYHTIGLSLDKSHVGQFKAGGTGSYTLNVTNTVTYPAINPPTEPQPVRVVDTLPAGLTFASGSGSGWSCSAVGQVVTCDMTSLQDLTTSRTFPPLTINVNVAANAAATLTNNAEVSDPTTSTLVFNVCETADNGVCPNSAVSTDGDITTILHSDLSTSSKTVLDVNGGDAQPGDILEYTITLTESAGIATSGVSVLDNMPANVGSLTVVSKPAGSTDSSTTTGGANGTGRLNITGISVPANGSATIVFRVTIAGGTASGTEIDNTATITNGDSLGAGASPQAPTVTVIQPGGSTSGKVLYVWNNDDTPSGNESLTRTPQSAGSSVTINEGSSNDWVLKPALAKNLTLAGNSTVSVTLVVQCVSTQGPNCRNGANLSWTAALYDSTTEGSAGTLIASAPGNATFNHAGYTPVTLNLTVNASGPTVASGHYLRLRVSNNSSSNNRSMRVQQYDSGDRSTVTLAQSTVIDVDSVQTYANASCTGTPPTPYHAGDTVYLCAVVSDPFGSDDINTSPGGTMPSIVISNAGGASLTSDDMTEVSSGSGGTKTFSYAYTVPATTSYGAWSAKVTAWEGTEHDVFDTGTGNFTVAAPPPNLSTSTKTVTDTNGGDALVGDVLEYTITLKETAGTVANNVSVADDIAAGLGGLTVVSKPAGSTDTSTTTGGAYGKGKLDIGGITVPANGSVTIVYQVTIAAGPTIDNTASITNPGGSNVNAVAPQVAVGTTPPVANGNKYLYLRNDNQFTKQLRRAQPTNDGTTVSINAGGSTERWTMSPVIPAGETLALPATVSGKIVIAATGTTGFNTNRTIRGSLWLNDTTQIGGNVDVSVSGNSTTPAIQTFTFNTGGATLTAGQYLVLRLQNNGSGSRNIAVYQRNGSSFPANYSYLTFNTTTVIQIDASAVYSQPASAGNGTKGAYVENESVYVRATVSDPFGTDDIGSVMVSIKDPSGNVVAVGAMTPLADADTTDGSRSYEFNFTVPTSATLGGWTAVITANEGTEGLVSDLRNVGFLVQGRVSLGKTWGGGATAGDTVSLTIGGATASTAGTSTAGGTTTSAIAAAASGATVTLGEAYTVGIAGNYTVSLACTRTRDGIAVTVAGTGLSRTFSMPADSGVACTWTNAKSVPLTIVKLSKVYSDPVNGTNNPKAIPGSTIEYEITVLNPSAVATDSGSVSVTDPLPPQVAMVVTDFDPLAAGTSPVEFSEPGGASGLTFTFSGLANGTDDLEFSGPSDASWTYAPSDSGDGTAPGVDAIRINLKGPFNPGKSFKLKFRVKVK